VTMRMVDGAECPKCGCCDTEVVSERDRWGSTKAQRRRCKHCAWRWLDVVKRDPQPTKPEPQPKHVIADVPIYWVAVPPACPACGCKSSKVTSTSRPIRRHKCDACGGRFKSCERSPA